MIEKALRERLEPIVTRRRRLYLARRLSIYWFVLGVAGLAVLGSARYSSAAVIALSAAAIAATILAVCRSRRLEPDYKALARRIEQQHPDLKALLRAAIEQEPLGPDGQYGYLQEKVIGEALAHARQHDWLQSIPTKKLVLAGIGRFAALVFLAAVISQILPLAFPSLPIRSVVPTHKDYEISVTPGDTTVEAGAPVVILARFAGRVPPEATLLVSESGAEEVPIALTRNLDDPVFGGIIEQVKSDLLYRIEYAGRRTRDYKISAYELPSLRTIDANIVYPSYTKLPDKVIKDTRRVNVVEGSKVTLRLTLNKPVATARFVAKDQPDLDLNVDQEYPNIYTGSIIATSNQRYELRLADAQGHTNKMPPGFVINVHKNMPADVKPVFPNRDVAASPLEELTLKAEVSDDFGLTACGLGYTLAGIESKTVTLALPAEPNTQPHITYILALEELNARPDQLLTYYFWADDVGPDGKTRRTSSDIYFAEVRHFEEIFRESQSFQGQQDENQSQTEQQDGPQQQDRQAEQLVRLQKQIITATWNIKQRAEQSGALDQDKDDLDVVRQSQADALEKARSALGQAEDPPAIEALQGATEHMGTSLTHLTRATESASTEELAPALGAEQSAYQELLKLREREHRVAQAQSSNRDSRASSARFERQLQQLELTERQNRYEAERLARQQQQEAQREDLAVLNRLSDLARRQNQMSEKLREAEASLRQARDDQERQEALRELRRLREQQLEALRDVDELQQRMEQPATRSRMAEARRRLGESRSRIRQSAQELEQGMISRAITSATRAQRELEQTRDQFRRDTSSQFAEQMRDMRQRARELDERQQEIADEITEQTDSRQRRLADSNVANELAERIDRQREGIRELTDSIRDVSEQAETSEPLLSRRLYDTLRTASTENLDRALEATGQLLRRSFLPQARDIERRAAEGIEQLRQGVEQAAESVLGDEAEALRLARSQLDELLRQVSDEVARAAGEARFDDPNEQATADPNQARLAAAEAARPGQPSGRRSQQPQQGRLTAGGPQDGNAPADSALRSARRAGGARTARSTAEGPDDPTGWGGAPGQWDDFGRRGPLTGDDFTQWSDRLGEVQEMLTDPDLRTELAVVRDRARAVRAEFKRHGKEPQWDMVNQTIAKPLTELYKRISDKLALLDSDKAMVPIDRDPVPSRFAELVRDYFENLGGDD
jgi:hypothetical protein